ncbi:UNVERIFIED_CONTAM: DUF4290 domain-containing protein [Prevotella sp. 15_C9]|uniref:DUF4290 domain-containing protein n=1 Tax=Prevotella TaxID=838 RepID=UPI00102FFE46|nr:DUF4290 domain-containing protein [Prevotella brunnea]MDR0185122.1 DUF4290 domain-containing protein [Prevotella brunnea]
MKIEGLDYNTQREKLVLPEYGREVQDMVNFCVKLPTKEERQRCAETIISIMDRMNRQNQENNDHVQKLWDHLALMADFKLDIDYPFDVTQAKKMSSRPEPMKYPMSKIPVRHYGKMMFEMFEKLKNMEEGEERNELICIIANQMKRSLMQWGHGSSDNEKVASDLAHYTDGKVQLDLDTFRFEKINARDLMPTRNNKKKR